MAAPSLPTLSYTNINISTIKIGATISLWTVSIPVANDGTWNVGDVVQVNAGSAY